MSREFGFHFEDRTTWVHIQDSFPLLHTIKEAFNQEGAVLLVCDTHTEAFAGAVLGRTAPEDTALCVLPPGETAKTWSSVEAIISAARGAGLGRDGLFIGLGGGVTGDLTAFAASVYMRGARLCLISTTLLGMVDASVGGKAGFDLLGIKNLAGSFYPAEHVYMPLEALSSLPGREWKSGLGELIKTAVLEEGETMFTLLKAMPAESFRRKPEQTGELIARSVEVKGHIVEADPRETGSGRALLNLGHTFAHALESAAGLGVLSHGEAVAWGLVRSCELGLALGITPPERARKIIRCVEDYGCETAAPHPLMSGDHNSTADYTETFFNALGGDKKRRGGKLTFIVPAAERAVSLGADAVPKQLLRDIIRGVRH
ncbi:MAG: 3-dehydroquinate synthase [Treponema sp.]|jgi:3-dehydroquinate synthase|nr:3-dehydroquinate synthase [Treponema sp.]